MLHYQKTRNDSPEKKIFLTVALAIIITALTVFIILYWQMNEVLTDQIRERAHRVNIYAEQHVSPTNFAFLNSPADKSSPRYHEVQQTLNDIRQIANVRYLYTAKWNEQKKPIYIVDGLPPDSEDFRQPGDEIEPDIIPVLNRCLNGEFVESDGILDTDWGSIYITCTPVKSHEITVGAIVMEFDARDIQTGNMMAILYSAALSILLTFFFIFITTKCLKHLATPLYRKLAYTDGLTGIFNRTAFELDLKEIQNRAESQSQIVTLVVYDLDALKIINDKQGHAAGDAYIKSMAHILGTESPAKHGQSYRIGGDEFVSIFLDEASADLEQELKNLHIRSSRKGLSYSYGIATFTPETDSDLHMTLTRADSLMYNFKKSRAKTLNQERGGCKKS